MKTAHPSDAATIRVGLYARVSTDKQAQEQTIASQVDALKHRIADDGLQLLEEHCFIDEGYSGSSLTRPALEHLRDLCASGGLDRLYVHSPDRLTRRHGHLLLLTEEWTHSQVEVVFLNRPIGGTPEDELLLQVQGVVAEYERAKILERCRRGRRFAAKRGQASALTHAPYGYRYVTKLEGGGTARVEVVLDQARIVQQIFEWLGVDRLSLRQICSRLTKRNEPSPTGLAYWNPSVIRQLVRNPAYKGMAAVGKSRHGPRRMRPRPVLRGRKLYDYSIYAVPSEEWISIPVPALVSDAAWAAAAEQLADMRLREQQHKVGSRCYMAAGLLVCQSCGYGWCGHTGNGYSYYLCNGADVSRIRGRVCDRRGGLPCDQTDAAIWADVCGLLREPQRIEREYQRRLDEASPDQSAGQGSLAVAIRQAERSLSRLIDAYQEGLLEKIEFEPRMKQIRERIHHLQEEAKKLEEHQHQEQQM